MKIEGDDDLPHFQVTVTYNVQAKDHLDAARKAYRLGAEMPPYEFAVKDAAGNPRDVHLDRFERDEAMGHQTRGE
ncbi:MAG: hypothetical protein DI537_13985 [Stutzerimonas stutzeri]|nr:MAG: hypothetical protein DI537_13985 [Stutzerimonas stutzeri]